MTANATKTSINIIAHSAGSGAELNVGAGGVSWRGTWLSLTATNAVQRVVME
jgi:hypothetical protein